MKFSFSSPEKGEHEYAGRSSDGTFEPLSTLKTWLDDAAELQLANPNAMVLATASPDGAPSARVVLCKAIEDDPPALVFFTNYRSRKGKEIETNPRAAAVFYWEQLGRQARIEGRIERTSSLESDQYFHSRPMLSRIGAHASRQSEPMTSSAVFALDIASAALRSGAGSSRPTHWGGYRMLIDRIEFWVEGAGRLHKRNVWTLNSKESQRWTRVRLYP